MNRLIVLLLSVCGLFAGCAGPCTDCTGPTYHPPELPPNDLATIVLPESHYADIVMFKSIDGLAANRTPGRNYLPRQLAPGRHRVVIWIRTRGGDGEVALWLDAQAGKTYQVKKEILGYGYHAWIEEQDTGRQVGGSGEPPSQ